MKSKFDINQLKITFRKKQWNSNYSYIAAVTYNGKRLKQLTRSCRVIYRYENVAIKIEQDELIQTKGEVRFYKRLIKKQVRYDLRYFPKLIAYDLKRGVVVQEFINLKAGKRTQKQRDIIDRIIKKYKINCDIDAEGDYNWGINAKNNLPVIYDLGFS